MIRQYSIKLRQKRFTLFLNKIKNLSSPIRILDLGGTYKFWQEVNFDKELNANSDFASITLLNLNKEKVNHPSFISVQGDATDLSDYKDDEFDIIFSNSLIEHLYTYDNQEKMAKSVMRIGKKYFIQTPNKYFPIEPHYFFPFFQFMPYPLKKILMMKTKIIEGKYHNEKSVQRAHDVIRLLSKEELGKLFIDGRIYREYLFGFTKSFMITNL